MAKKPTKTTAKQPSAKVRDLAARKNPKGGAQKREGPALGGSTRGRSPRAPAKRSRCSGGHAGRKLCPGPIALRSVRRGRIFLI